MKELLVVAAVLVKGEKILATQRGYGPQKDGWEFPGGKVEPGESPRTALKREIREELKARISVGEALPPVEMDYPQFHLRLQCYLCSLEDGGLELVEHEAARWVGKDEVLEVDWLPADRAVVDSLLKMWEKGSLRA